MTGAGQAATALALAALALGGCGDGGDSSGDTASSGTGPPEAGATSAELSTATTTAGHASKVEPAASSTGTEDPKKAIAGAIEAVLAPRSPELARRAACGSLVTDRYVEAAYGNRQGCTRAQLPGSAADSVEFGRISLTGPTATVFVTPSGGPSSGELITVRLIREGSVWRVDSLRSNAPVGP